MKLKYVSLFFCLLFTLLTIFPSYAANVDPIDHYVQSEMKKNDIPSLSLAIIKAGKLVKVKSYGIANKELNVPSSPISVYQTGSTGKAFTATLIMMLVEKGKINLNDKVSKYIEGTPESWENITIHHLLSHTSGLKNYDLYLQFNRDYTDEELIKEAERYPLDFQPGSKWRYSNTGYMLLGVIIKKVTGKFYGDLLQEFIFTPLNMTTAGVCDARKIIPNRVSGYEFIDNKLLNQNYASPSLSRTADGTLYMNILDFAKWSNALDSEKLLKKSSLDLMYVPVKLNDGKTYNYGYGWFIEEMNGHPIIEHGGEFQGFSSYISRYIKDKLTIILITNRAYIADVVGDMAHEIAGLYDKTLIPTKKIRNKPME